jgi:hypothetical protein
MARKNVLVKCAAAQMQVVNDKIVDLYGDDPGTQEISLNAYVGGNDPYTATHSIACVNMPEVDAATLVTFVAAISGCDTATFPTSQVVDFWTCAYDLWSLNALQYQE